jgi:hypothetical protein
MKIGFAFAEFSEILFNSTGLSSMLFECINYFIQRRLGEYLFRILLTERMKLLL